MQDPFTWSCAVTICIWTRQVAAVVKQLGGDKLLIIMSPWESALIIREHFCTGSETRACHTYQS